MGGAIFSDILFFTSIKDKIIDNHELKFLKLASVIVWIGLTLLILSGFALVLLDINHYLNSSKFLAKFFVVLIITTNGLAFEFLHMPWFEQIQNKNLNTEPSYKIRRPYLLVSGSISVISWITTLILGTFKSLPFSFFQIILGYLFLITSAIIGSLILKNFLLPISSQSETTTSN